MTITTTTASSTVDGWTRRKWVGVDGDGIFRERWQQQQQQLLSEWEALVILVSAILSLLQNLCDSRHLGTWFLLLRRYIYIYILFKEEHRTSAARPFLSIARLIWKFPTHNQWFALSYSPSFSLIRALTEKYTATHFTIAFYLSLLLFSFSSFGFLKKTLFLRYSYLFFFFVFLFMLFLRSFSSLQITEV